MSYIKRQLPEPMMTRGQYGDYVTHEIACIFEHSDDMPNGGYRAMTADEFRNMPERVCWKVWDTSYGWL